MLKQLIWVGSSKRDLKQFPRSAQRNIGQALFTAQAGGTDPSAKPLKGFKGTSVMEISERYRTDTYRMVYTAQIGEVRGGPHRLDRDFDLISEIF